MLPIIPALLLALASTVQDRPDAPKQQPPASSPSTRPAAKEPRFPKPVGPQVEVLQKLLRRSEERRPLAPQADNAATNRNASSPADGTESALLPENTVIMQRSGRFIRRGDQGHFVFQTAVPGMSAESVEINKNRLLELMEREAERAGAEFVISAEITIYRGQNYLNLLMVRRSLPHGNLGP